MATTTTTTTAALSAWRLRWPLYVGMGVAGTAAVVASASTLAELAETAGWSGWTPWLLPAAVDIGGSAGGWCWLRPGIPSRARRFGRVVALSGAAGSLAGNASGHLMASGYLVAGPVLVVVVGATPAVVLVALAHLAALLTDERPIGDGDHGPENPPTTDAEASEQPELADLPDQQNDDDWSSPAEEQTDEGQEVGQEVGPDTRLQVLQLIGAEPRTIAELAAITGRSRSTINGHLTALVRAGAVRRESDKRYRPLPRLVSHEGEDFWSGEDEL